MLITLNTSLILYLYYKFLYTSSTGTKIQYKNSKNFYVWFDNIPKIVHSV